MNADHQRWAEEIVEMLKTIPSQKWDNSRPLWTLRIKQAMAQIGRSHDFRVCPSDDEGDECQWLYDLIWYCNKEGGLEQVPLVLESEWSLHPYDLRVDFEKLLIATAPLKILVFEDYPERIEATFATLQQGINRCLFQVDCLYILACYWTDGSQVKIKSFEKAGEKSAVLIPALSTP